MNIGVIGLGSIGERHVRNMQRLFPSARIDILTRRAKWSDAGKNTRLVASSRTFFKTQHDVCFVTNETALHDNTILRCLAQKPRGMFVEKPLSHTARNTARMRSILRKHKIVFFVGYCLQFSKPLLTIKKLLAKNTIGDVLSMRVSVGQDLRTWRTGDYTKRYSVDPKRGGGVILDLIHELNYPTWLLDEPMTFVSGFSSTVNLPIRAEDVSEGIFRTTGGTIVSIHQDYLQIPGRRYCEIVGARGTLMWESDLGTVTIKTKLRKKTIRVSEERNRMYERELVFFMSQVTKKTDFSNFEEAARDVINALQLKKTYAAR